MFLTNLQSANCKKKKKFPTHVLLIKLSLLNVFIACDNWNFLTTLITEIGAVEKQEKSFENTCEGAHFHRQVIFNDFAKHLNYLSLGWESLGICIS